MSHLDDSYRRLAKDVQAMLADVDDMLDALKVERAGWTEEARVRWLAGLRRARIGVAQAKATARARAWRAAGDADVFAHRHPWRTAGFAIGAGAILGAILGALAVRSPRDRD